MSEPWKLYTVGSVLITAAIAVSGAPLNASLSAAGVFFLLAAVFRIKFFGDH